MDEAGARMRTFGGSKIITVAEIEAIVSKIAQIPAQTVSAKDKDKLRNLEKDLKTVVFGQNDAVERLTKAVLMSRSGLGSKDKPVGSFLLAGPTGVGKTEVAKQLAKTLGVEFIRFDMSEYMEQHSVSKLIGTPPGYVGYEQGGILVDKIRNNPHAVLLLDEIEKAHPSVFNVLLQVMDYGKLTDNKDKSADFRNVVILMTSNVGAEAAKKRSIGFGEITKVDDNKNDALKNVFSPEFRNRLDSIIQFNQLDKENILSIVDKFLSGLSVDLAEKSVEVQYTDKLKNYLAEKGFDPLMGARPMTRLIQEKVKQPLAVELLFGSLSDGGKAVIDLEEVNGEYNILIQKVDSFEEKKEKKTTRKKKELV